MLEILNVSRETSEALNQFADEIRKWNSRINLVSSSTVDEIWHRHIHDSAQLFEYLRPTDKIWADLGSGAGFPGMVIAILAKNLKPDLKVSLIEKDQRKSEFLKHVARLTDTPINVRNERIENIDPLRADVISARALAPVSKLLTLAVPHLNPEGICVFLKGRNLDSELTEARSFWQMNVERKPSRTSSDGTILKVKDIRHV